MTYIVKQEAGFLSWEGGYTHVRRPEDALQFNTVLGAQEAAFSAVQDPRQRGSIVDRREAIRQFYGD